jgi:hypothetical protein
MTTPASAGTQASKSTGAGSVTLALGILFTASVAYAYGFGLSDSFDPPRWLRVIGLRWLPIGFGGVPIGYDHYARMGGGRGRGRLGVLVGLVGLVAFVALVTALG